MFLNCESEHGLPQARIPALATNYVPLSREFYPSAPSQQRILCVAGCSGGCCFTTLFIWHRSASNGREGNRAAHETNPSLHSQNETAVLKAAWSFWHKNCLQRTGIMSKQNCKFEPTPMFLILPYSCSASVLTRVQKETAGSSGMILLCVFIWC